MDKMLINDIACMKSFDNGFGKRITNLCYHILPVINEHNTLTGWQLLTFTKLMPFGFIYKETIGFCYGNYTCTL